MCYNVTTFNFLREKNMREVEQMSYKTVINRVNSKKQNRFWISGSKLEKYSYSEGQQFSFNFTVPQEVTVEIEPWKYNKNAICNLVIMDYDGNREIKGLEFSTMGIKFFQTEDLAQQYFILQSNKLRNLLQPMLDKCDEIQKIRASNEVV